MIILKHIMLIPLVILGYLIVKKFGLEAWALAMLLAVCAQFHTLMNFN